jgi:hypothetical protein
MTNQRDCRQPKGSFDSGGMAACAQDDNQQRWLDAVLKRRST